jgi:hypothetical protein
LDLRAAFATPPNVFDNFVREREISAIQVAQESQQRLGELEAELDRTREAAAQEQARSREVERSLGAV